MERYTIVRKTEKEIVFSSAEDMQRFFEEVTNGKYVVLEFPVANTRHGELISPDIMADISTKKVVIKSEQSTR